SRRRRPTLPLLRRPRRPSPPPNRRAARRRPRRRRGRESSSIRRRCRPTIPDRGNRRTSAATSASTPANDCRRSGQAMDPKMSPSSVVIAGAGHAGVQAAASLREDGFDGEIVLISDEKDLPYQRPPLSKAFLKGEMDIHGLPLRGEAYFRDQRIDLRLGVSAMRIDRTAQRVETSDGKTIGYGHLILATGARRRRLEAPGAELPGVFYLRTIADATRIRERLAPGRGVVVIGAGFIGLEIAATAANLGADVTVVEIARPMGRAVSTVMSDFFLKAHAGFGAKVRIGRGLTAITGAGKAEAVALTDGEVLPAELVIVGVGVAAEDQLARDCGLECMNGVVVDAH